MIKTKSELNKNLIFFDIKASPDKIVFFVCRQQKNTVKIIFVTKKLKKFQASGFKLKDVPTWNLKLET